MKHFKRVVLTIFCLVAWSITLKRSGEQDGKEVDRGGAEQGGYVGDSGKLGEGGRELLVMCVFAAWISRNSPPLTMRKQRRHVWINLHRLNVRVTMNYMNKLGLGLGLGFKVRVVTCRLRGLWVDWKHSGFTDWRLHSKILKYKTMKAF